MRPVKNIYRNWVARIFLLTGYLFLFTTQFNYRYYDAANFFVYGHDSAANHAALTKQKIGTFVLYRNNAENTAHLSVDKRFQFRACVKALPVVIQAPVPTYIIITRKALPPPAVYSTPDLPTNALRGPPTA